MSNTTSLDDHILILVPQQRNLVEDGQNHTKRS